METVLLLWLLLECECLRSFKRCFLVFLVLFFRLLPAALCISSCWRLCCCIRSCCPSSHRSAVLHQDLDTTNPVAGSGEFKTRTTTSNSMLRKCSNVYMVVAVVVTASDVVVGAEDSEFSVLSSTEPMLELRLLLQVAGILGEATPAASSTEPRLLLRLLRRIVATFLQLLPLPLGVSIVVPTPADDEEGGG